MLVKVLSKMTVFGSYILCKGCLCPFNINSLTLYVFLGTRIEQVLIKN